MGSGQLRRRRHIGNKVTIILEVRVSALACFGIGMSLMPELQFNASSNLVMLKLTALGQCFVRAFAGKHRYRIVDCG